MKPGDVVANNKIHGFDIFLENNQPRWLWRFIAFDPETNQPWLLKDKESISFGVTWVVEKPVPPEWMPQIAEQILKE